MNAADDDEYVDEEVEWEDVADDTNVDGEVDAAAGGHDITIEFETGTGGKKRVKRVPISKEYRLHCRGLHRVHLLCLLARARLHDEAASKPELQAQMLSLLPLRLLPALPTAAKPALPALKQQLDWFKSTFSLMAHSEDNASSLPDLAARALHLKAGPADLLVLLFIALLRAQGLLVRFVALLDAMALEPWRRAAPKPVRVLSVREAQAKEEAHLRKRALEQQEESKGSGGEGKGGKAAKRGADGWLDDEVEDAVRVLLTGADFKKYSFKDLMEDLIEQLPDVTFSKPVQKSIKQLMAEIVSADKDEPKAASRAKRGRAKADDAEASKRSRRSGAAAAAGSVSMPGGDAVAPGGGRQRSSGSGAVAAADNEGAGPRVNRGEEEFDRELQVALMATAAEAEARERRKLTGSEAGPGQSSAAFPGDPDKRPKGKGLRAQLLGRPGGKASAKGESAADVSAGLVSGSRGGLVPLVWAEVYVGSAETGRWLHVDVINGLVDRPDSVEAATQRSSPAAYIVACSPAPAPATAPPSPEEAGSSGGAGAGAGAAAQVQEVKDVTSRYLSSLLGLSKVRDGQWWEATLSQLFGPPAASGQLPGPSRARPSPAQAQAVDPGDSEALRAKREDAELQQRASSQLQGLPASIEGFKQHPVYVLKRHITKYEALRPGTAPLGTHRGEAFYARAALSVLHTAERWRREGREVRSDELSNPSKVVVKRKQPPAPGAGPGGYGGYGGNPYGGWGRGAGRGPGRGAGAGAGARNKKKVDDEDSLGEEGDLGEEPSSSNPAPTVNLYGAWQTEPWRRPRAEGGIVPKNERGNVDCPPLVQDLPIGTVHLQYPASIGGVCRSLNIDFAPALVGFEIQAGRMLPRFEGVVVCEEFERQVVATYLERETAKQEVLAARRRREAASSWVQLLQAMRTRLQLKSSYEGAAPGRALSAAHTAAVVDVVDLTDGEPVLSQRQVKLQQLRDKYEQQQQQPRTAAATAAAGAGKPEQPAAVSGMEVEEI